MGVNFNLKRNNGDLYECSSICFGVLNQFPIDVLDVLRRDFTKWESEDLGDKSLHARDLTHVEYCVSDCEINQNEREGFDLFNDLKKLFDDLPMFGGMVRIMPRKKVIRVSLGNNEADKVMMALMIGRSLCRSCDRDYLRSMLYARKQGFSPRTSVLASHFFKNDARYHRPEGFPVCIEEVNEASIFHRSTFGKVSARAFMSQDTNYSPWFQDAFKVNGYKRDDHYRRDKVEFNPLCPLYDGSQINDSDHNQSYYRSQGTRYRRLVDCFSIKGDKEPLHDKMFLNEFNEFQNNIGDDSWMSNAQFDDILTDFEEMRGDV